MGNTVKVNFEVLARAKEIHDRGRNATKEERQQMIKELEFEHEAFKQGWSDEEKEQNREAFEKKREEEDRIEREEISLETTYLLNGGKTLSEFDKARAKYLVKKHPETAEILAELFRMLGWL